MFSFADSFKNWSRIPVDDFDYLNADELLSLHQLQLQELFEVAAKIRWDKNAWRNRDNKLIEFMNAANIQGKMVMDFGCGLGLDAYKFLELGAGEVVLADLHPKLLLVAQRILCLQGRIARKLELVRPDPPFFDHSIDLFWSMGVLHHTPRAGELLKQACKCLKPNGECRILLYSDIRWKQMTGTEPPRNAPIELHPKFKEFVEKCDTVGSYADFYDQEKVEKLVDGFGVVTGCQYLCDNQFIGVMIKPRG